MDSSTAPDRTALALRWIYRLILGREPEPEQSSEKLPRRTDIGALLRGTAASPEGLMMHDSGHPLRGDWGAEPVTAEDVAIVHALRHGRAPTAKECAAGLALHRDAASLRAEFLASPECAALYAELAIGPGRATVTVGPDRFELEGLRHDEHFAQLAAGGIEPSLPLLGRFTRALLPDGGEGAVLVDAGANIGLTALVMAAAAPRHKRLLAVEADARNTPLLRANLAANGFPRAEVFEIALGAAAGQIPFRVALRNRATGQLLPRRDRSSPRSGEVHVRVPVRTLDRLLTQRRCDRLDLLKLDVEGSEPAVLQGAGEWLARHRGAAFVEVNLWTLMAVARRNPLEQVEEWMAAFPHLVVFGLDGTPLPVQGPEGAQAFVHHLVTARGGLADVVLCHDLAWLGRWA